MNEMNALVTKAGIMLLDYSRPGFVRRLKNVIKKMIGRNVPKRNYISWPTGLCALGLYEFIKKDPESAAAAQTEKKLCLYFDRWIENGSRIGRVEDVLAGYVLLKLTELKKEYREKYSDAADLFSEYLKEARKDRKGTYIYNPVLKEDLVLADMIGMVCPFLSALGRENTKTAALQITNFMESSHDGGTGLPFHGYTDEGGNITTCGIVGWGRTLGWLLLGISLTLTEDRKCERYEEIKEYLIRLTLSLQRYVLPDGLFAWQLTEKGPTDTSGSAMIAYSLKKVLKEGVITSEDGGIYECAQGIVSDVEKAIKKYITPDGDVTDALAECLGPGLHPQKYGSYPWSVGPTLALLSI